MTTAWRSLRPRTRAALVALAAVAAAVALQTLELLRFGFTNWDDDRFLTNNPLFHGPVGAYVVAALTRVQFEAYQPLHLLSYVPDRLLWPDRAAGFHALNLVALALAAGALYRLIAPRFGPLPAAIAALVWATHPLLVEPTAWISERKGLVALALGFAALRAIDRARGVRDVVAFNVLAALAMLAKSHLVVLPLVAVAWQRWVGGRSWRQAIAPAAPLALLGATGALVVRSIWLEHAMLHPTRPMNALADVVTTIGFYTGRVLAPVDLAALYPATPSPALTVLGLGLLAGAGVWLAVRRPGGVFVFALVAYALALAPVANLAPLYFRYADRYQALSLAMVAIGAAGALARLPAGRQAALGGVLLALNVVARAAPLGAWRDSRALWTRATEVQPRAFFAHLKLAESAIEQRAWSDASRAYVAAIAVEPDSALGYVGASWAAARELESRGRLPAGAADDARQRLRVALTSPDSLDAEVTRLGASGCGPCANVVLALRLRAYPLADEALVARARAALEAGLPTVALVCLSRVAAPSADSAALSRRAEAALAPR